MNLTIRGISALRRWGSQYEKKYIELTKEDIEFVDRDSGIDFNTEMKRIQKDFRKLLQEEKGSQQQLINAFKISGYEL